MSAPVAVDFRGTIDDGAGRVTGDLGPPGAMARATMAVSAGAEGPDRRQRRQADDEAREGGNDDDTRRHRRSTTARSPATGRVRSTIEASKTRYAVDLTVPSLALAEPPAEARHTRPQGRPPARAGGRLRRTGSSPTRRCRSVRSAAIEGEGSLAIGELKLRRRPAPRAVSRRSSRPRDANVDSQVRRRMRCSADRCAASCSSTARRSDAPAVQAAGGCAGPRSAEARGRGGRQARNPRRQGAREHRRQRPRHDAASRREHDERNDRRGVGPGDARARDDARRVGGLRRSPARSIRCSTVDAATELRCAVVPAAAADGVARVDRSIAIETGKIDASASGTLDFRDETLDLSVQPQIRAGRPVRRVAVRGPRAHSRAASTSRRSRSTLRSRRK